MPGTNSILPFAQAGGANVQSDAAYLAASQRTAGNQPGVALSALVNKALLQTSAIAAGIAQFLADWQGTNITDQLSAAALSTIMENAAVAAAGVRFNSVQQYTVSGQTFTAAQAHQFIVSAVAGAASHTLPANTAMKLGDLIMVKNAGTSTATINRAGTDLLNVNGATFNALVLQPGEEAIFVSAGSGLWFVFGSGALSRSGGFLSSLASSGYQRLPTGFIIQWSASTSIAQGGSQAVTFPIAFPNQCLSVVPAPNLSSTNTLSYSVGSGNYALGGCTIYNNSGTSGVVIANYIAIGF